MQGRGGNAIQVRYDASPSSSSCAAIVIVAGGKPRFTIAVALAAAVFYALCAGAAVAAFRAASKAAVWFVACFRAPEALIATG